MNPNLLKSWRFQALSEFPHSRRTIAPCGSGSGGFSPAATICFWNFNISAFLSCGTGPSILPCVFQLPLKWPLQKSSHPSCLKCGHCPPQPPFQVLAWHLPTASFALRIRSLISCFHFSWHSRRSSFFNKASCASFWLDLEKGNPAAKRVLLNSTEASKYLLHVKYTRLKRSPWNGWVKWSRFPLKCVHLPRMSIQDPW